MAQRLIVGALLVLLAVAAADAVRSRGGEEAGTPRAAPAWPEAALREAGAAGTLVYTTPRCRLRAVRLPGGEAQPLPRGREGVGCPFELSPDGRRVAPGGTAWSPDGRLVARCAGGGTEATRAADGSHVYVVDGCAPAWRAANALVVAEGRGLTQVLVDCRREPRCYRRVLDEDDLLAAARRHLNVADGETPGISVTDQVWLGEDTVALFLLVRTRFAAAYGELVVFRRGRLVLAQGVLHDRHSRLRASRSGRFVAAGRDLVADLLGGTIQVPDAFGPVAAVAFSPDERWLALAARDAVALVSLPDARRIVKLPLAASDLAWRE